LPWLVLAVAGGPVAGLAINAIVLFFRRQWLRPSWSACSLETSGHILHMGILFFILQVAMAIGYQSDNLVLAHILGPKSVTQYTIPQRLFQFIPTFIGFFMLALWPAYSEAAARRDARWIMKTYRWSMRLNLAIGVPLALLLFYAAPTMVDYWVGGEVHPSKLLLIALVGFCLTNTIVGPISALLNGLHVLRFQAVTWSVMAAMNLAISILLTKQIGLSGVAFGSMIAQLLCIIVPSILYIPRCFRRLQEESTGAVL
jgi:O-antigen/teichoic acid export membrane protein